MSVEVLIKSPLKSTKSQDFCFTRAETKAERKLYHLIIIIIQLNIPAVLHIGFKANNADVFQKPVCANSGGGKTSQH